MQSLRLVHHYTIASSDIFSPDACTSEIWRVTVPQAAFSHEFLMHGLLAVSALHYAQTHPDEREEYLIISSHYQGLALQFFATRLGDISDDNFEPFFFLATFIFLWNIYTFSDSHQDAKPVSTAEIAQSFKLLHGIKSICDARPSGWREDGPLAPLFEQWEVFPVDRTGPFHAQMDRLYDLARDLNPSFDAINTQSSCLLAIETLRTTYAACMCDKSEKQAQRIWFWPITLTQVFMDLVKTNHPVALIILAHYAALARTFEKNNWINMGWSAKVMGAVETTLDEKWNEWLAWPFKSLRDEIDVNKMDPPNT
ncbi:hypothetical protein BKA56DRAFT_637721 [Ilyonectria sp. MPI-CAGE-AT-0026]|nr:hypothetical protein BKA56DRAFT_637721 [Ilyonectria sp. MPI-CAGE-AT-0026]